LSYDSIVACSIMRCCINKVIFDTHIFSRNVPAPSNGLDNFQFAKEAVRHVECSQLWAKDLSWRWVVKTLGVGALGTYAVSIIPPLFSETVEGSPFNIIWADNAYFLPMDVEPGCCISLKQFFIYPSCLIGGDVHWVDCW